MATKLAGSLSVGDVIVRDGLDWEVARISDAGFNVELRLVRITETIQRVYGRRDRVDFYPGL